MRPRNVAADIRVGIFVLAALAILIVGSLWIAGSRFLGPTKASYRVLSRDSAGMETGDRVRVAGVVVGRIKNVRLGESQEWPVLIDVAVRKSVPLYADASAKIVMASLMGANFLQIEPGSPDAGPLPEGAEILAGGGSGIEGIMGQVDEISVKTTELMDKLGTMLDDVTAQVKPILENLQLLLSEENAANVEQLLADLRKTAGEIGPRVTPLLTRVEHIAEQLEGGTDRIPELSDQLESLLADVRTALGPEGSRLAGVLDSAEGSLARADQTLTIFGDNRAEIEATLRDLRDAVANLKALSQNLKERPNRLLFSKPEKDRRPGEGVAEEDR